MLFFNIFSTFWKYMIKFISSFKTSKLKTSLLMIMVT